jgi:hypothetical protein
MMKRDKLDIGGWHKGKCYFIVIDISEKYQKNKNIIRMQILCGKYQTCIKNHTGISLWM